MYTCKGREPKRRRHEDDKDWGTDNWTLLSAFSGLTEVLMAFQKKGFRMQGMVMVTNGLKDWVTGESAMVPAVLLRKEI